jgi:hypothetical protein
MTYDKLNFKWKSSVPKNWKKLLANSRPKTDNEKPSRNLTSETNKTQTENTSKGDSVFQFNFPDVSNKELLSNNHEMNKSLFEKEKNQSFIIHSKHASTPSYAMQYLGITKGQIGIFTKRLPIPQMSAYETCQNTPLSVIYSTYSPSQSLRKLCKPKPKVYTALNLTKKNSSPERTVSNFSNFSNPGETNVQDPAQEEILDTSKNNFPDKILDQISNQIQDQVFDHTTDQASKPEKQEDDDWRDLDNYWPDPSEYDQQIIHTYARPRAISHLRNIETFNPTTPINIENFNPQYTAFQERFKSYKQDSVVTPTHRRGMKGAKLSRPRSLISRRSKSRLVTSPLLKRRDIRLEVLDKATDSPAEAKYYKEPYLKYLAIKTSKYDIHK